MTAEPGEGGGEVGGLEDQGAGDYGVGAGRVQGGHGVSANATIGDEADGMFGMFGQEGARFAETIAGLRGEIAAFDANLGA